MDNQSLEVIIKEHGNLVSNICRKMLQNEETAKDAAQEVWMEIIKNLPAFRAESKLSTWIYTITRRVVLRYSKNEKIYNTKFLKNYFHGEPLEIPDHIDYDKSLWIKEMCDKCLTGILHCLDNESRLIYLFRDLIMLPYKDISSIVGKNEPTVRKIISRSRTKLKNFLEDECTLYNPNGSCKCRMHKLVHEIGLPQEYAKVKRFAQEVLLFKETQNQLPPQNFWEKYYR